ncbi:MAG TPA: extracellular solute-binding protein [Chloroflexota bacterium]|nr:extracellular solute-binding protein [Chloroflexota bacterium]
MPVTPRTSGTALTASTPATPAAPKGPRRRAVLGLAATTLAAPAWSLAACSRAGQEAPGRSAGPPVTISFFYPNWGQPAIYEAKENRKIQAFRRQFERIELQAAPVPENYGPQLTALFAAGTPPETFWADHQAVLPYAKQGFLDDLQPTAQQDRTFRKEDLHPAAIDGLTVGNKLWGLTGWAFTNLYYYNSDLFQQAGLPTPYERWKQDTWTWDAFLDAVVKLHKRDGGTTVQVGTTLGQARLWMNTAGAQEFDNLKTPTRCLYDAEAALEALQFRYDLQARHRVHDPDFYTRSGLNETTAFINGKSATMSRWTTGLHDFKAIGTFKWGMVPYPKKKTYASDYTHWAYARARGLPDDHKRSAAWEWLKFFTGNEGQKLEAEDMVGIPFTRAAQEIFTRSVRQLSALEHPDAMAEILNKYPHSRLIAVDTPEIGKLLTEEMTPFWNGERSARAAATAATQRVNEYLRSHPQTVS